MGRRPFLIPLSLILSALLTAPIKAQQPVVVLNVELPPARMHLDDLLTLWREVTHQAFALPRAEWPEGMYQSYSVFTTDHEGVSTKSLDSAIARLTPGAAIDRLSFAVRDQRGGQPGDGRPFPPIWFVGLTLHRGANTLQLQGADSVRMEQVASFVRERLDPHAPRMSLRTHRSLHAGLMALGFVLAPATLLMRDRRAKWLLYTLSALLLTATYLNPPPKSMPRTLIETRKR